MENKPIFNKKSELELYTEQAFSRLSKEKLVIIASNLAQMPVEVARKALEHVPEYFGICKEALERYCSTHDAMIANSEHNAQKVFDSYDDRKKVLEKELASAKTLEERKCFIDEIRKVDKEKADLREKIEKEKEKSRKEFLRGLIIFLSLAGGAIGISAGIGKHRH